MKPARFEYRCPTTVSAAIEQLAEAGEEARFLAGGQSLIPLMGLRLAAPTRLIDLGRIPELRYVEVADGLLRIGAMTTQRTLERSTAVAEAAPLLAGAMPYIGHRAIRARGTIGGSVCHADPTAELPVVLRALDAEFVAQGPAGPRTIPAEDFFETLFTSALQEDEMLVEVRIPTTTGRRWWFDEVSRRHGDFAIVSCAAIVGRNGDPPRVVLGGMASTPLRVEKAEQHIGGDPEAARAAARVGVQDTDPTTDLHASAATRRRIAEALVARALRAVTATDGTSEGEKR
ncbi:FAD binding domain-containing protein [Capillimicrobium parvum]|uniref:6-hydroxypseudooxynicotine dehydrogenase complex subunit alpha n=1 Tax=Capillimicrobium parvum TaxID=2884022 RepID=A0A9E7C0X2_9ACTN|nr:xanthine dehydrogenase family protein subunit M [Capillimicrobium parvum]UGS35982.1 6-hydroxypseudooxynicotine dehydrogenase complex subunit alpha [Capillimicrobium parvum]